MVTLTSSEQAALERLEERERHLRRGAVLLRERDPAGEMFILKSGIMMSSVMLADGSRQILRFHFAGDMLAVASLVYNESTETITALSPCTVCPFERGLFSMLITDHPRIAALVIVSNQIEHVALTDRLAAIGRTSAKARVAAALIELRNRRRALDRETTTRFPLGLTQEELGDATGLTAVHVNRMLRQLEDEGMISRESGQVTFTDERSLAREANFVDRYAGVDLGWLPAAR